MDRSDYIKKLVYINNQNQQPIIPEEERKSDWRYQLMELSPVDLQIELFTWSREKMITWLVWCDPNGYGKMRMLPARVGNLYPEMQQ